MSAAALLLALAAASTPHLQLAEPRLTLTAEQQGDPPTFVHIESDDPEVQLFQIFGHSVGTGYVNGGAATIYTTHLGRLCRAPCDRFVEHAELDFFIDGDGISTSKAFTLLDRGPSLTLKVKTGSSLLRGGGYLLVSLAITAVLIGGTFLALGSLSPAIGDVGLYTLIGGGVGLAAGIPMIVFSGTSVEFLPGPALKAPPAKSTDVTAWNDR